MLIFLLFSDQILGGEAKISEGKTNRLRRGSPLPPPSVEKSQTEAINLNEIRSQMICTGLSNAKN